MLQQGLGPKVVADRLGHSTTRMTLDVYAHVAPELEERAAGAVDAAMRAVRNERSVRSALGDESEAADSEKEKAAQSLTPQGFEMVGATGLEPVTPTVSM